jgi:hypothetical protein
MYTRAKKSMFEENKIQFQDLIDYMKVSSHIVNVICDDKNIPRVSYYMSLGYTQEEAFCIVGGKLITNIYNKDDPGLYTIITNLTYSIISTHGFSGLTFFKNLDGCIDIMFVQNREIALNNFGYDIPVYVTGKKQDSLPKIICICVILGHNELAHDILTWCVERKTYPCIKTFDTVAIKIITKSSCYFNYDGTHMFHDEKIMRKLSQELAFNIDSMYVDDTVTRIYERKEINKRNYQSEAIEEDDIGILCITI